MPSPRILVALAVTAATGLVAALVMVVVLAGRIGGLESDVDDLTDANAALAAEVEQVRGAAALLADQTLGLGEALATGGPELVAGLDEAIAGLESFTTSIIEVDVPVDTEVPISTEIPIQLDFEVPVDETISISETIDTTITVEGPLGLEVPVDVSVPVDVDVPVVLDLTVPVDERLPVDVDLPVRLDLPVRIEVADTELATLGASLTEGLRAVRDLLAGLG